MLIEKKHVLQKHKLVQKFKVQEIEILKASKKSKTKSTKLLMDVFVSQTHTHTEGQRMNVRTC